MFGEFIQRTGRFRIYQRETVVYETTGYAGSGAGLNSPEHQMFRNVGPLPAGVYRIEAARVHPRLGPLSMPLRPYGQDMYGRSGFWIHGDNRNRNRTASSGCIILDRAHRLTIHKWIEGRLLLVEREEPSEAAAIAAAIRA